MRIRASASEGLKSILLILYIAPILAFLVGIKDQNIWPDYEVYLNYYKTSSINTIHDIFFNIQDPFYVILNKPFSGMDNGFEAFLLTCSFITISLKILALKKSTDNFPILLILYISYLLCLHDYIQIRIALSISLMLFAVYCVEKNLIKYAIFSIGCLIHLSAGIIVIVYVFDMFFKRKRVYFFLFVIIAIIFTQLISLGILGGHRAELYAELARNKISYYDMNVFTTIPILQSIGLVYMFYKYKAEALNFEYYISLFGVIVFYLLSSIPVIASRTFDITLVFYIILLSRYFRKDNILKTIAILLFLVEVKKLFYSESALLRYYTKFVLDSL